MLYFSLFFINSLSGFPLFDPAIGNYQQSANAGGGKDCFFAKLCLTNIVGIKEYSLNNSEFLTAYPNPNNGDFNITMSNFNSANCTYQLIDVMGRIIESGVKEISEENIRFNFANKNYKTGFYFLKLNSKNNQTVIKFIKE